MKMIFFISLLFLNFANATLTPGGGSSPSVAAFDPTSGSQVFTEFEDFDTWAVTNSSSTYTYGPLHLLFSGTNAKSAPTSSETNRFGVISSTVTATGISGYFGGVSNGVYPGVANVTWASALQLGSNIPSGSGNSYLFYSGLGDSFPTQTNGAYFYFNYLAANIQAQTATGGVSTTVDTGIPYAINTWYNFRVVLTPTNATFYINGTSVAVITTHLPAATSVGPFVAITNQTGSGVTVRHDWTMMQYLLNSNRGTL